LCPGNQTNPMNELSRPSSMTVSPFHEAEL
jgi:hypothetical protein